MKHFHFIIITISISLFNHVISSHCEVQPTNESSNLILDLNKPIQIDPSITTGQLQNGLRYYIRFNKKPENRAELRLAVNVGSVLEDDDQQGLAHFCEHMAFNGTKNFAKHELIDYLESIGMKFGPEINAYTGFDETVYMLEVPTDSAEIMEKAFQILEDWAHQVSFEAEEIDKERGVVIEEWRLGRGAEARMWDKHFPILFKDSQYADRLPIGKKSILESFNHGILRRFYQDWYRPDLMAVVAIGDFDETWIENLIKKHFSSIPVAASARERTLFPVPDHEETLFTIATDPEATSSRVSIYYKMELLPEKTMADYRRLIMENLHDGMMNERLNELTKKADPPFIFAISGKGKFVRSKGVYYLGAGVKDNGIERGLEALLTEAERVKKYGFTQTELDRTKKEMLRRIERAYKERDKTKSYIFASEYIRNFLTGEPIPGIEYEFEVQKKIIPDIKLEEINLLTNEWITDKNRVILVNTPEKTGLITPTKEKLLSVFEKVYQKDIMAYTDRVSDQPLIDSLPKPAEIIREYTIDTLDVIEWKLSNGIRVILKPTDFKNDEILFTSFSLGGNSLVPDQNYISSVTAASIIEQGGVGRFDQIELGKKLTGKVVGVSPFISALTEGISGSASPQDVETMFQLIYLYITSPRKDTTAFLSYKTKIKGLIENRSARPETAFQDTISVTMAQYHYRARPWSEELIEEMNLDSLFKIYKDRFSDTGDFTFFFVGNFDSEKLKPLIKTYLGGLPSIHREETWKDTGIEYPKGIIHKTVKKGIEPKSRVRMIFTGPYKWSRQNNYNLESMISVMRIKLRETLREDLGGTYGASIGASKSKYPREDYSISISFGCAPERIQELTNTVFMIIDSLKTFGPDEIYIKKIKEIQIREYETDLKENNFWLTSLKTAYFYKRDPVSIIKYRNFVENLSAKDIQKAAINYFNKENYVRVVLVPEKD